MIVRSSPLASTDFFRSISVFNRAEYVSYSSSDLEVVVHLTLTDPFLFPRQSLMGCTEWRVRLAPSFLALPLRLIEPPFSSMKTEAFSRILGVKPAFMRPPFGDYNDNVREVAYARNQSSEHSSPSPNSIKRRFTERAFICSFLGLIVVSCISTHTDPEGPILGSCATSWTPKSNHAIAKPYLTLSLLPLSFKGIVGPRYQRFGRRHRCSSEAGVRGRRQCPPQHDAIPQS